MKSWEYTKAGKRDRLVNIQQQVRVQDVTGQETVSWSTVHTLWAAKNPGKGRETFEASQLTALNKDTFSILYRSGIAADMRLLEGSTVYNIHSVNEIGRKEGMELICERKDNRREDGR